MSTPKQLLAKFIQWFKNLHITRFEANEYPGG